MSTGKWETVNGVRFPVEGLGWEDPNEEWESLHHPSEGAGGPEGGSRGRSRCRRNQRLRRRPRLRRRRLRAGVRDRFPHDGKTWEIVKVLTPEEALAIHNATRKTQDWSKSTYEELMDAAFGEGVPGVTKYSSEECIVVRMGDEKTQMPFGFAETSPFLELLWRKTGADCAGEEAELELPSGTYRILLED